MLALALFVATPHRPAGACDSLARPRARTSSRLKEDRAAHPLNAAARTTLLRIITAILQSVARRRRSCIPLPCADAPLRALPVPLFSAHMRHTRPPPKMDTNTATRPTHTPALPQRSHSAFLNCCTSRPLAAWQSSQPLPLSLDLHGCQSNPDSFHAVRLDIADIADKRAAMRMRRARCLGSWRLFGRRGG